MPGNVASADHQQPPVYAYTWNAWNGRLFPTLCSYAQKIESKMRQSNPGILKQIATGKAYFLFHVNLTKTSFFYRNKNELVQELHFLAAGLV